MQSMTWLEVLRTPLGNYRCIGLHKRSMECSVGAIWVYVLFLQTAKLMPAEATWIHAGPARIPELHGNLRWGSLTLWPSSRRNTLITLAKL